jgi:hypothetical protein
VPLALIAPVVVVVLCAAATAILLGRDERSVVALRAEVAALAQLRAAQDRLVHDLERTRRNLRRPAEVWPSGPDR